MLAPACETSVPDTRVPGTGFAGGVLGLNLLKYLYAHARELTRRRAAPDSTARATLRSVS